MSTATLRCRVCERTQPLAPLSACPTCNEPLDVGYELGAGVLLPRNGAPRSMWRYADALPARLRRRRDAGPDAARPAPRLSRALGIDLC